MFPDYSHQESMINAIKEFLDIKLQHPVIFPTSLAGHPNRING